MTILENIDILSSPRYMNIPFWSVIWSHDPGVPNFSNLSLKPCLNEVILPCIVLIFSFLWNIWIISLSFVQIVDLLPFLEENRIVQSGFHNESSVSWRMRVTSSNNLKGVRPERCYQRSISSDENQITDTFTLLSNNKNVIDQIPFKWIRIDTVKAEILGIRLSAEHF